MNRVGQAERRLVRCLTHNLEGDGHPPAFIWTWGHYSVRVLEAAEYKRAGGSIRINTKTGEVYDEEAMESTLYKA